MLPYLLVIAKSPAPGRSKTRLSPPCTPDQAAELAEASLADTLETVAATPAGGRRLVLDGQPGEWLPGGIEVVPQVEGGLGDRLAAAFADVPGPALLIGMDTPQVTTELLGQGLRKLSEDDTDGVLGLCFDGGYWAIGFDGRQPGVFEGVPMSTGETGCLQQQRMEDLGMKVAGLPQLRDIDLFSDAVTVAAENPGGRFADCLAAMEVPVA